MPAYPRVVLVARDADIADLVDQCARKKLAFSGPNSLCSELHRRGFNSNSAYEMVMAAEAAIASDEESL